MGLKKIVFVVCCILAPGNFSCYGQSGGAAAIGGGGGGGAPPALTVTVTSDVPASGETMIGNVHAFSFTCDGTAPFFAVGEVHCGPGGNLNPGVTDTPFTWCFQSEGTFEIKILVTDSSQPVQRSGIGTLIVNCVGPLTIFRDTDDVSTPCTGGGSVSWVVHKFYPQRNNVNVGPCWNTCGYEWVVFEDPPGSGLFPGPTPPADVKLWDAQPQGNRGCSAGPGDDSFFWIAPYIYDKKIWVEPANVNWALVPVGSVLKKYKQWIAVRVPICGNPNQTERFVVVGPYEFWKVYQGTTTTPRWKDVKQ